MVALISILLVLLSTASVMLAAPTQSTKSIQPTQPIEVKLSLKRVHKSTTTFVEPDKLYRDGDETWSLQFTIVTADTKKDTITFSPAKEPGHRRHWTLKRHISQALGSSNIELGTLSFTTAKKQEEFLGSGTEQGELAAGKFEGSTRTSVIWSVIDRIPGYTKLEELRTATDNPMGYSRRIMEGKSFNVDNMLRRS
ncbi:hypothetical protein F5878DRAFT_664849 [Lentinula raphanica]|uniref:Uncharacterized protein n=1 Tax=Lentinula raphanica TaxID=153919 RepID=A0AA38U8I1_9AGAR|nr:hypothetical protein F5878DRAFT_664849 [Lentinula raphanica]